jgi:hypothetical protein
MAYQQNRQKLLNDETLNCEKELLREMRRSKTSRNFFYECVCVCERAMVRTRVCADLVCIFLLRTSRSNGCQIPNLC